MSTTPEQTASALRAGGIRDAFTAEQPEYAASLTGFNTAIVHQPDVVVVPHGVDEVIAAVRISNQHGLPITVVGRGHGPLGPIRGGVAVATTGLAYVTVDAAGRTARVGAGATWNDVLSGVTPFGLAALSGSAPHVGVVGYLLGGGIGPVARTFGFAADHVRSIEVVTADGVLLVADAEHNPDLFWALRGGKGGFGVVTAVVIDLFPLSSIYGGGLYFAAGDAAAVLGAFAEWSPALPTSVTTSVALLRLPPIPELPEPLRGRFVVHLRYAHVGGSDEGTRLLAPMRAVATPLIDAVAELPYAQIGLVHSDPVNPMPVAEGGVLLSSFDADAAAALLDAVGPEREVPLAAVEVRLLGGALAREATPPNAVGGRDAAYSLHVVGAPVPELLGTVIPAVIRGTFQAIAPWRSGGTQINFVGGVNDGAEFGSAWSAETAERLARLRAFYDPQGRFPYGQSQRG